MSTEFEFGYSNKFPRCTWRNRAVTFQFFQSAFTPRVIPIEFARWIGLCVHGEAAGKLAVATCLLTSQSTAISLHRRPLSYIPRTLSNQYLNCVHSGNIVETGNAARKGKKTRERSGKARVSLIVKARVVCLLTMARLRIVLCTRIWKTIVSRYRKRLLQICL